MKVLSLFSGGGLGDYGLTLAGMEIVGQVEIEEYCQKILALRWPDVPKWRDIREVKGDEIRERCGTVDLVSGGFPCQPFSTAGKREGKNDKRHLWPEMFRVICEVKPRWVLAENVPGLLSINDGWVFGDVVRDLASCGYGVEWDCIPACAVGAPHRRDRVWIVAYSESVGTQRGFFQSREKRGVSGEDGKDRRSADVGFSQSEGLERATRASIQRQNDGFASSSGNVGYADSGRSSRSDSLPAGEKAGNGVSSPTSSGVSDSERLNGHGKASAAEKEKSFRWSKAPVSKCDWWTTEPDVGRVAHGVAKRVDRLKLLGNGQVVQVVQWIGEQIMQIERIAQ